MKNGKSDEFQKSPELAEVKVSYKMKLKDVVRVTSSRDAFNVLFPLFDADTIGFWEDFFLLLLNRASYALGWFKLSSGGTAGTVVDPKLVFMLALKTNACSIILCHNHPSGNLNPSNPDKCITEKIKKGAELLEIRLYDHLIVSPDSGYFSFADEGVL